jgi:hypothetical protein
MIKNFVLKLMNQFETKLLMKPQKRAVMIVMLLAGFCLSARAQNYSIDWHKIAGGGGTSSNGQYVVSGTIGQHDASQQPMTGGNYSLTGGFWSLLSVVQTPGAPLLKITFTPEHTAVISWPSSATGFSLQQSSDLGSGSWTTPAESVSDDGTNKSIVVNPPSGNRFYRLFKP